MIVKLYQNKSQANKVDKDITEIASHSCNLKSETSAVNPVIMLESVGFPHVNYAYIDEFDRYYFIDNVKNMRANIWEFSLRCDVLMSFKDDIRNATAIVSRQSNEFNLYLNDGTFKAFQNPQTQLLTFPNGFTNPSYVLLVAGAHYEENENE